VHSLLCVPLTVFQRVIGCIYVDSNSPGNRLLEEHLQLVTAIAGISAMALENAGRLQWLEQENERLTEEVSQERSPGGRRPADEGDLPISQTCGTDRLNRID